MPAKKPAAKPADLDSDTAEPTPAKPARKPAKTAPAKAAEPPAAKAAKAAPARAATAEPVKAKATAKRTPEPAAPAEPPAAPGLVHPPGAQGQTVKLTRVAATEAEKPAPQAVVKRSVRAPITEVPPAVAIAAPVPPTRPRQERDALIREAAYYRAQARAFTPLLAVDDWLHAEQEVDRRYRFA